MGRQTVEGWIGIEEGRRRWGGGGQGRFCSSAAAAARPAEFTGADLAASDDPGGKVGCAHAGAKTSASACSGGLVPGRCCCCCCCCGCIGDSRGREAEGRGGKRSGGRAHRADSRAAEGRGGTRSGGRARADSREAEGRGGKRSGGRARAISRAAEGRGGKRNGGRARADSREAEGRGGKRSGGRARAISRARPRRRCHCCCSLRHLNRPLTWFRYCILMPCC